MKLWSKDSQDPTTCSCKGPARKTFLTKYDTIQTKIFMYEKKCRCPNALLHIHAQKNLNLQKCKKEHQNASNHVVRFLPRGEPRLSLVGDSDHGSHPWGVQTPLLHNNARKNLNLSKKKRKNNIKMHQIMLNYVVRFLPRGEP